MQLSINLPSGKNTFSPNVNVLDRADWIDAIKSIAKRQKDKHNEPRKRIRCPPSGYYDWRKFSCHPHHHNDWKVINSSCGWSIGVEETDKMRKPRTGWRATENCTHPPQPPQPTIIFDQSAHHPLLEGALRIWVAKDGLAIGGAQMGGLDYIHIFLTTLPKSLKISQKLTRVVESFKF